MLRRVFRPTGLVKAVVPPERKPEPKTHGGALLSASSAAAALYEWAGIDHNYAMPGGPAGLQAPFRPCAREASLGNAAFLAATVISVRELADQFWPVVALSFAISVVSTPLCRAFALRRGIVDRPDDFLKPHGKPIPYLGGVAIFLGWLGGIVLALVLLQVNVRLIGIALAGLAIMLIGLFDDLRVMRPKVKLLLNLGVAALVICLGLGDQLTDAFARMQFARDDRLLELVYSVPLALFIIVGACNATNLIDGMDGLCTGVLGIISVGFVLVAGHLRLYSGTDVADERLVLSLAMLGAAAGFLPYNRNPATIFMGDAGSMLLGLNAAILILMFTETGLPRWTLGALMVFGLPTADMILTLIRRWRNGRPLMIGDRSHFYDQLRDRGFTVRQVVAISYVLAAGFVLVGASVIYLRTRYAILLCIFTVIAAVAAVWKFNMVSIEREPASSPAPEDAAQVKS